MPLTAEQVLLEHGIVADPVDVIASAQAAGIEAALNAAKLQKESYGGKNVFGNDRVPYPTSGPYTADTVTVTYEACQAYLRWSGAAAGRQNGVGPCQLTYRPFQLDAERRGGLHVPLINMTVGAAELARCLRAGRGSLREAGARNNGGDRWREAAPAKRVQAEEYGVDLERRTAVLRRALTGAVVSGAATPAGADRKRRQQTLLT